MKKILIIGGGLSGISSAVFLSKYGFDIEIIEASPKMGGRTYSLNYNGIEVDNGQHILMECYKNTLEYIDLIGTRNLFDFQKSLSVNYVNDKKELFHFKIPKYFYPINHFIGLMQFKLLSIKDRFSVLKMFVKIRVTRTAKFNDKTVYEFLKENNQSEDVINKFWESLIISTMNTSAKTASSKLFVEMMKIIFFEDKKNSNIVIPKVDLSNALINPALSFLETKGVKISTSERLIAINLNEGKVLEIETNRRKISDFDAIISSIPLFSLSKIIFGKSLPKISFPKLEYSPIVTVHVWLTENPLKEKMYNLIGSEFDWVFNHKTHLSFVKSNAKNLANLNKNIVIKIVFSELKKYFTILTKTEIKDYIVLKEKHATFIPDLNSNEARKSISKIANNLYIIGNWTNTGLPATIEGAIKSGKDITQKITFK